jgi:hypothetical protein
MVRIQKKLAKKVESMSLDDVSRRCKLESAIQEHIQSGKTFIVAAALRCISEEQLYVPESSIYEYANKKFGMSRRTTNTYVCAAYVYESLLEDPSLPRPTNISHIRSLHKYSPHERRCIWKMVTQTGQTITEELVVHTTSLFQSGIAFTELKNEFYTPKQIMEAALKTTPNGVFDLDPATSLYCNQGRGMMIAQTIYTESDNGFHRQWFGNVWLSPPVVDAESSNTGRNIPSEWFHLAEIKYFGEEIESCLVLLKMERNTTWFQRVFQYPHCILKEEIQFENPIGKHTVIDSHFVVVYLYVSFM